MCHSMIVSGNDIGEENCINYKVVNVISEIDVMKERNNLEL